MMMIDDDNVSTISGNLHSSNEDLDEVEDKMPEIAIKKVRKHRSTNRIDFFFFSLRKKSIQPMIH